MIELIYNEEEVKEEETECLPLPKNIRQIGEPGERKKILIEDFVHTYLQQYSQSNGCENSLAVLLGKSESRSGKRNLYIKSAWPLEGVGEKQGRYDFSEKVWGRIYQECEKYFPGQEILGWFLARPGFALEKNSAMEETHRTYFSGADKVLYLLEPLEKEGVFLGFNGSRFEKQTGYYIYYEKNAPMREFIMSKNNMEKKESPTEKPDAAMANFRKILKEKREKTAKRKRLAVSYGTKVAAALVLFVGVVAMQNRLGEEQPVQQTFQSQTQEVIVEDLSGNVEMQTEPEEAVSIEPVEPEEAVSAETVEPQEPELPVLQTNVQYIVQKGDTLAQICRMHYGTDEKISEVCAANGITDGDYIQAGEIILLP